MVSCLSHTSTARASVVQGRRGGEGGNGATCAGSVQVVNWRQRMFSRHPGMMTWNAARRQYGKSISSGSRISQNRLLEGCFMIVSTCQVSASVRGQFCSEAMAGGGNKQPLFLGTSGTKSGLLSTCRVPRVALRFREFERGL